MTDKTCEKCGESLSSKSSICPACGHSPAAGREGKRPVNDHFIIIIVLAVAAVVFMVYRSMAPDQAELADPRGQRSAAGYGDMTDMADFTSNLPGEFEPLVSMGNALMDQGNYEMAVECYARAVELRPESPDVLTDLGACRHALGLNEEAIADFEKALAADPAHPVAKFNLGIVYVTLGDTATARQWWEKLLAENPPPELRERVESLLK